MPGYNRKSSRAQSQQELTFNQNRFDGALNLDVPANKIETNELPLLENLVCYPDRLESVSGTQQYTSTTLPGSGTVVSQKQHPATGKWLLQRGSHLYTAPASMSSWTEVTAIGTNNRQSVSINGTWATQVTAAELYRMSGSNTNYDGSSAITVYGNLSQSGGVTTINLYKDLAKANLVGTGLRVGNGKINITQSNDSGLGGTLTVTYTVDTSSATNTLTTTWSNVFNSSIYSKIKEYKTDFVLFNNFSGSYIFYVDMTNNKFFAINMTQGGGFISQSVGNVGAQGAATPYGRRYLTTFSRIVNASGVAVASANRLTGTLLFEGAANNNFNSGSTNTTTDYGSYWSANSVSVSNPNTVVFTDTGVTSSYNYPLGGGSQAHYTHISLYATLDVGVNGISANGGQGNDSEIYIWVADIDITALSYSDTKTDEELRPLIIAGYPYLLETRFFREVQNGAVADLDHNFMYSAHRNDTKLDYCQLGPHMGYHNPLQYINFDDSMQTLQVTTSNLIVLCTSKTYSINANLNQSLDNFEFVQIIQSRDLISDTIGCSDYGSIANLDADSFIAVCSDHTIRIFQTTWTDTDFAEHKISSIVKSILVGSVGVYQNRVYTLWYHTDSGITYNDSCLRLGLGKDAGYGWSKRTGDSWIYPPTYVGAFVIYDSNNIQRTIALNQADNIFYWIETFTGYTGSGLTRVHLEKVAVNGTGGSAIRPKLKIRQLTGTLEQYDCILQECHIKTTPIGSDYISGYQVDTSAYVNGSTTAVETVTNSPYNGDIQFFKEIEGKTIQLQFAFLSGGFAITSISATYYSLDRKSITNSITTSDNYTYQLALASDLDYWITRSNPTYKNLVNNTNGTITGAGAGNVTTATGPDQKTASALAFGSGITQITYAAPAASYTEFSLFAWVKTPTLQSLLLQNIINASTFNGIYLYFNSNTQMDVFGFGNVTISSVASGWHLFHITRPAASSTISVYQNGSSSAAGTVTSSATLAGGTLILGDPFGSISGTGLWASLYNKAKSNAAASYYYNDIVSTTSQGGLVLPVF